MTKERLVFFVLLRVCVCHCVFIYLGIPRYNQERNPPRSITVTIQTQTTHIRTQKRNCTHQCYTSVAQNIEVYRRPVLVPIFRYVIVSTNLNTFDGFRILLTDSGCVHRIIYNLYIYILYILYNIYKIYYIQSIQIQIYTFIQNRSKILFNILNFQKFTINQIYNSVFNILPYIITNIKKLL